MKSASDNVTRRGMSYSGVAAVDERTVNLVLEILGEIVGTKWTVVVTDGITQYAVECPPQPLSVAFIDADLVSPVSVVLVGVQRPHRLHPLVPLRLVRLGLLHYITNLLPNLLLKEFLKSVNIWRSYRQNG